MTHRFCRGAEDFDGNTFVAFTDISGFRELMRDRRTAAGALNAFYQAGYDILRDQEMHPPRVDGLFVSDCGVLFVRPANRRPAEALSIMLRVIELLNQQVLQHRVMLTTSIAYGHFRYHRRLEFPGIEKNPVCGNAYLEAYLDNDAGRPSIQPGQCRLITRGLPDDFDVRHADGRLASPRGAHRYFYWMVTSADHVPAFERRYKDAYSLKYTGMLNALRDAVAGNPEGDA